MLNQDSIYVILYSIPIYQLLFYTVQLVTFKRTSPSKRYLGFLLLTMTAFLVMNAIYHLGYGGLFSKLYYFFIPVLLCLAPVFFLYILSLTREDHDVKRNEKIVLFIPPVVVLVVNIFIFGLLPGESRETFIRQGFSADPSGLPGLKLVGIISWYGSISLLALQVILAGIKIRKILLAETSIMKQRPGYLAYLDLKWVIGISGSVLIFLLLNGLINVIAPFKSIEAAVVYNVLMLLAGGIAGIYGMKQNSLLMQVSKMTVPDSEVVTTYKEPASVLRVSETEEQKQSDFMSEEEAERIIGNIIHLMDEQKPYLRQDFSMGDLCNMLKENRRKVTYVINDVMNKNFYGIVNDYRIREAVNILINEKLNNYKIEVIAEMVGFQSKSSFNACFKKYTGHTPSAYKAAMSNLKDISA